MSGTTMSTPSNSASGNIRPASTTMMSSPQRMAMQFIPNSPSPPSGTICSFPFDIRQIDASTVRGSVETGLAPSPLDKARDAASRHFAGKRRRRKARLINSYLKMTDENRDENKSWMRRHVEGAIRGGLTRAYETIKVDPGRFLMQLRVAHGLPLATFRGVYTLPVERLDDVAESVIRGGMKLAAAEGAGFGLG